MFYQWIYVVILSFSRTSHVCLIALFIEGDVKETLCLVALSMKTTVYSTSFCIGMVFQLMGYMPL